jgi:anthranilate synthase/aminodeoxychorismate synthase-like glutamine amidotransferase
VRVLLIDNYDSFAYNLVQALRALGAAVDVVRNDAIPAVEAAAAQVDRIVVSPGPCTPKEAGISVEVCRRARVPLLGVCLGHQCLVEAFGGRVGRAGKVVHGKTSLIEHDGQGWLRGLPMPLVAARYHSLVATELPAEFAPCAHSRDDRELMAIRHKDRPLMGVQFHPESFLTPDGPHLLRNFLESSEP